MAGMSIRSLSPVGTPLRLRTIMDAVRTATSGPRTTHALGSTLATRLGVKACLPVSSGRAALTLILEALKESASPSRNEVVIPAYTCFSVPSAIVRAGLKIVPCDIDPEHVDFAQTLLPRVVSSRTLCVVVNHLFGFPARIDQVLAVAREHGAAVVDDAAQSLGATLHGRQVGTLGDVGFLSLGRGKPLTAIDGGIIILPRSDTLARRLESRVHALPSPARVPWRMVAKALVYSTFLAPERFGIAARLPFVHVGESRFSPDFHIGQLSAFQSELAAATLSEQPAVTERRRAHARVLLEALAPIPNLRPLAPVEGADPVYLRLPLRSSAPVVDRLYEELAARRLGASRMYPTAITGIPGLARHLIPSAPTCAEADRVARSLVTLPTHPLVTAADLDAMIGCVGRVARA